MREIFYVNGAFVDRAEARVSVEDRGYQFADGVYEVTRFHGHRGLRLHQHQQRLQESANHLRIAGQPSVDEWQSVISRLVHMAGVPDDESSLVTLYQQVTRGDAPRNHTFPKTPVRPGVVAYFKSAPIFTMEQRLAGIGLSMQPDERWERCYIKSICLLPAILAKQAAVEAGATEAVLVRSGFITEGGSTNIFCIRGGKVYTHPTGNRILSGITRSLILEAAARAGVTVVEQAVTLEQFLTADEIFVSSTTLDIMPATSVDGRPVGDGIAGIITRSLIQHLATLVEEDIRRPAVL